MFSLFDITTIILMARRKRLLPGAFRHRAELSFWLFQPHERILEVGLGILGLTLSFSGCTFLSVRRAQSAIPARPRAF